MMIIDKVDDGKKFPRCPDCDVVLYQESDDFSYVQKAGKDELGGYGYLLGVIQVPSARLMRCPKCAALYHVEDGDQ